MGEVTQLTELPAHVLRNWEKKFSQLKPKKNSAGNRAYKEEEVQLIFKIKEMLMDQKLSPEGVKRLLNGEPDSSDNALQADVKKDLMEMKVFLNGLLEKL